MNENEILDLGTSSEGLVITPQSRVFLKETAKWAKFLAIVGFIGIGFMVILGLFMGGTMASLSSEMGMFGGGFFTVFYLLFAALYFFPVLYLYRFSDKMQNALRNNSTEVLTNALENLKSHYKFLGILMAIILGFYALILVFGLIFGVASAF